jgi:hypothetical protein
MQFTILTHKRFVLPTQRMFTHHLPVLCDNCILTPALTTDVYKQYNTACPLFTAAAIRYVLCANSHTLISYTLPQRLGQQSFVEHLVIEQIDFL